MRERSFQSPKEIHSARDVRSQFFHNRKNAKKHEVFSIPQQIMRRTFQQFRLSEYMNWYFRWPKFGCRFVDVSAQDASQHGCMYSRIQAITPIFTVFPPPPPFLALPLLLRGFGGGRTSPPPPPTHPCPMQKAAICAVVSHIRHERQCLIN